MHVPFFTNEDNLAALKKMKIMFLMNSIKNADIFLLFMTLAPFSINFVFFIFLKGENSISKLFYTFGSVFNSSRASFSDWATWYGSLHLSGLILSILGRIVLARRMMEKMKKYQKQNQNFKWTTKSKFWLVAFLPFVSFIVYPILHRLSETELIHKYNL